MNGVTTTYYLEGDQVAYEESFNVSNPDTKFNQIYYTYTSDGTFVSMNLEGVEYYYIRNIQGDIIGLYDKAGIHVAAYTYDSWGKLLNIKDQNGQDITNDKTSIGYKNPYRYRGYRYDSETGLYYLQSRYYNPVWGRFINADVVIGANGEILTHNMFAYTLNNPINMEDQSGYFVFFLPLVAKLFVAAAAVVTTYAYIKFIEPAAKKLSKDLGHLIASSKSKEDPYARPNQKKQGRERKEKKRTDDNWKSNSNKKPKPLKKHTPGREQENINIEGIC